MISSDIKTWNPLTYRILSLQFTVIILHPSPFLHFLTICLLSFPSFAHSPYLPSLLIYLLSPPPLFPVSLLPPPLFSSSLTPYLPCFLPPSFFSFSLPLYLPSLLPSSFLLPLPSSSCCIFHTIASLNAL